MPPKAFFYSDHSEESDEARKLFEENGINFKEWISPEDYVPEKGLVPPFVHTEDGEFRELEGIKIWIDIELNCPPIR